MKHSYTYQLHIFDDMMIAYFGSLDVNVLWSRAVLLCILGSAAGLCSSTE